MTVERFKGQDTLPAYKRFQEDGRMLPPEQLRENDRPIPGRQVVRGVPGEPQIRITGRDHGQRYGRALLERFAMRCPDRR
jgi:hypothetical protein